MAGRGKPAAEAARITRTSAACMACRARKQKCSGEKPQCAQCGINKVRCEWPQQQKRGPPKQYTSALEARLFETENILIALLAQVSDEQLASGFERLGALQELKFDRKDKLGPAYWSEYPLRSAEDVRRWSESRSSGALAEGSHQSPKDLGISPHRSLVDPGLEAEDYMQDENEGSQPDTSINYGCSRMQFDEPSDVIEPDFDGGMEMADTAEEQRSPSRRQPQVNIPTAGERTSQKRQGKDLDGQPSQSGSFDSAFIW